MSAEVQATVETLARDGLSLAMIGDEVGLSVDAVRSRLARRGLRATHPREIDVRTRAEALPPREAVDYLLGVVGNLLDVLDAPDHATDRWARWSVCEKRIVRALFDAEGAHMSRERLMSAVYYDKSVDDLPMNKIIDVFICRIRAKLPRGVTISTSWGQGWAMQLPAWLVEAAK